MKATSPVCVLPLCPLSLQGVEGEDSEEWRGWRLLTMAGLFDCWTPPGGGEPLYTYTIITVEASRAMDWVHDR